MPITITELKILAELRLKEAKELYAQGLYDGACYLAGYAVELALKAKICKLLDIIFYPETGDIGKAYKTHKLTDLITLAGLRSDLSSRIITVDFENNWLTVDQWSEQWRYSPPTKNQQEATNFLNAMEDPANGIFTWIKSTW